MRGKLKDAGNVVCAFMRLQCNSLQWCWCWWGWNVPAGVLPMRKMSNNSGERFGIIDGNYWWELLLRIGHDSFFPWLNPQTQVEYSGQQFLEQIENPRGVGNGRGEAQVHINRGGRGRANIATQCWLWEKILKSSRANCVRLLAQFAITNKHVSLPSIYMLCPLRIQYSAYK